MEVVIQFSEEEKKSEIHDRVTGYYTTKHDQPNVPVYVVDLAGLQFQQAYNSGRLVLITSDQSGRRALDDFIFENVVGEKKMTYEEASAKANQGDKRFLAVQSKFRRTRTVQ